MEKNESVEPFVSIVTPVYNRKDIIIKGIESMISQGIQNYILLLIDDASTGGTQRILEGYAAKYPNHIIFHYCALNKGPSAAAQVQ